MKTMKIHEEEVKTKTKYVRKKREKDEWYLKDGKSETIMFVNATPGEWMKRKVEKLAKKHKIKMKVVERRGQSMKKRLQKSDPFKKINCDIKDCVICKEGMNVDCRKRGVVYEIECKENECGKKYIGQTGRSLYERVREHENYSEKDIENDSKPLARHSYECHGNDRIKYDVRIIGNMQGKPSKRMIGEAVYIDSLPRHKSMNGKRGWSTALII